MHGMYEIYIYFQVKRGPTRKTLILEWWVKMQYWKQIYAMKESIGSLHSATGCVLHIETVSASTSAYVEGDANYSITNLQIFKLK